MKQLEAKKKNVMAFYDLWAARERIVATTACH